MTPRLTVTILGCGASGGVPLIGCDCAVCRSPNPKNKRTRSALLVEGGGTRILIDAGPDLRQQALREGIASVDAILFTHTHADHCHGIDDARAFNFHRGEPLPIYGTQEVLAELQQRFGYAFGEGRTKDGVWMRPSLLPTPIVAHTPFTIGALTIMPFTQHHGKGTTLGFRIGAMAYSTDVDHLPNTAAPHLHGLDLWILDCLRYQPAATHAHLAQSLGWVTEYAPRQTLLTHMAHELEYEQLMTELPPHVRPAYDGLRIIVG